MKLFVLNFSTDKAPSYFIVEVIRETKTEIHVAWHDSGNSIDFFNKEKDREKLVGKVLYKVDPVWVTPISEKYAKFITTKRFSLSKNFIQFQGRKLFQIQANKSFNISIDPSVSVLVKKGDLGGWVENENNLSQSGTCWLFNSMLIGESKVSGRAIVRDSLVSGHVTVSGKTQIYKSCLSGSVAVTGESSIFFSSLGENIEIDEARIFDSMVYGKAIVKEARISNSIINDSVSIAGKQTRVEHSVISGNSKILNSSGVSKSSISENSVINGGVVGDSHIINSEFSGLIYNSVLENQVVKGVAKTPVVLQEEGRSLSKLLDLLSIQKP